jgi:hypothetical protein
VFRFIETRTFEAVWIFDLEDAYLKRLCGDNAHPRPLEPLIFELTGQEIGGVMEDLPVPRELVITVNPSGFHLFFGQERLADDWLRAFSLPPGRYLVRIRSPYYQPLEFSLPLPMPSLRRDDPSDPDPWAEFSRLLEPAGAYPFPSAARYRSEEDPGPCGASVTPSASAATRLRGGLFHSDGRGLKGSMVEIAGRSNTYRVGPDGQWVLWFDPGDDTLTGLHTVIITLPGGADASVPEVCVVRGKETSLPATALRGYVLQNGIGAEGAEIEVSGFAEAVATQADGAWWYYFLPNQAEQDITITATLPDGSSQSADTRIISRGTVFVPSFQFP